MYARFLRWASDRLGKNGIIAFVSNNSFIDARTYDGFRKVVTEEFNQIYIINLKGNARTSGERRRREGGNIFNNTIRVGIAVYFLIRKENAQGYRIYYNAVSDYTNADEKKSYLSSNKFQELQFEQLIPDRDNNWLDLTDNDFESLLPLANKVTKSGEDEQAVFKLFSLGVITARDEWVYDTSAENLRRKVRYLIDTYNQDVDNRVTRSSSSNQPQAPNPLIKWTRAVKNDLNKGKKYRFSAIYIRDSLYRPFVKRKLYFSKDLNEMQYQLGQIFINNNTQNLLISFSDPGSPKPFMVLATNKIPDYHLVGDSQCLSLYRYDKEGNRIDNITDWGLAQFQNHYSRDVVSNVFTITKLDIFHYTYAVLHYPAYRQKYEINLKREFPRLPFYDNFYQWVSWGKQLMELHINYETVAPLPLRRINLPLDNDGRSRFKPIKAKLKEDKDRGLIILDTVTTLEGVPEIAWEYQLGDRSALEWVLDRYKEKKPKDSTIAERFNTYRFADYKEQAIDLLQRVCTVSMETMRIIQEMEG
jgi:predicted helicase